MQCELLVHESRNRSAGYINPNSLDTVVKTLLKFLKFTHSYKVKSAFPDNIISKMVSYSHISEQAKLLYTLKDNINAQ